MVNPSPPILCFPIRTLSWIDAILNQGFVWRYSVPISHIFIYIFICNIQWKELLRSAFYTFLLPGWVPNLKGKSCNIHDRNLSVQPWSLGTPVTSLQECSRGASAASAARYSALCYRGSDCSSRLNMCRMLHPLLQPMVKKRIERGYAGSWWSLSQEGDSKKRVIDI